MAPTSGRSTEECPGGSAGLGEPSPWPKECQQGINKLNKYLLNSPACQPLCVMGALEVSFGATAHGLGSPSGLGLLVEMKSGAQSGSGPELTLWSSQAYGCF